MFKGNASKLNFRLEEGMGIIVNGRVDVFERDGRYQIYVNSITQEGIGDLYQKLQELMERYRKSEFLMKNTRSRYLNLLQR